MFLTPSQHAKYKGQTNEYGIQSLELDFCVYALLFQIKYVPIFGSTYAHGNSPLISGISKSESLGPRTIRISLGPRTITEALGPRTICIFLGTRTITKALGPRAIIKALG